MLPFGQIVYLWRVDRGMTQNELSRGSGVSRPNLSAIENGVRSVTLETVHSLARSLGVRAGELVDGTLPSPTHLTLTRTRMDRIARRVAGEDISLSRDEKKLADDLRSLVKQKLSMNRSKRNRLPRSARRENLVFLKLKDEIGAASLQNLFSRIEKKAGLAHE